MDIKEYLWKLKLLFGMSEDEDSKLSFALARKIRTRTLKYELKLSANVTTIFVFDVPTRQRGSVLYFLGYFWAHIFITLYSSLTSLPSLLGCSKSHQISTYQFFTINTTEVVICIYVYTYPSFCLHFNQR